MSSDCIHLKILLPFAVFADSDTVTSLIAPTVSGSFGILPHRRDCVVALMPGILSYKSTEGGEVFVALDDGILVKAGREVMVSARNAIGGQELGKLREAVTTQFATQDEQDIQLKQVAAKLETTLVRSLVEMQRA